MANAWRVKQYYRGRGSDSSLVTFSSVDDAKTKIGLKNAHLTTGSPTVTYALEDSGQSLVVTFEFEGEANFEKAQNHLDTGQPTSTLGQ